MKDIRLLLDNIRSVHNAGSIFRTAETLGITRIYCAGTTPLPLDRFNRKRNDFAKVSLGAEDMVPWEHVEDGEKVVKNMSKEKFTIIALEQAPGSVDYKEVLLPEKALIILGNEVDGVSAELLKKANVIAEIPHAGRKESLNVSIAAAVFLYRLVDR